MYLSRSSQWHSSDLKYTPSTGRKAQKFHSISNGFHHGFAILLQNSSCFHHFFHHFATIFSRLFRLGTAPGPEPKIQVSEPICTSAPETLQRQDASGQTNGYFRMFQGIAIWSNGSNCDNILCKPKQVLLQWSLCVKRWLCTMLRETYPSTFLNCISLPWKPSHLSPQKHSSNEQFQPSMWSWAPALQHVGITNTSAALAQHFGTYLVHASALSMDDLWRSLKNAQLSQVTM